MAELNVTSHTLTKADFAAKDTGLTSITISTLNYDSKGLKALCDTLKRNASTLQELHLVGGINDDVITAIAKIFSKNNFPNLQVFDLSAGQLEGKGFDAVKDICMKVKPTLKTFGLIGIPIDAYAMMTLGIFIKNSPELQTLILHKNGMDLDGTGKIFQSLKSCLQVNQSLTQISLVDNNNIDAGLINAAMQFVPRGLETRNVHVSTLIARGLGKVLTPDRQCLDVSC